MGNLNENYDEKIVMLGARMDLHYRRNEKGVVEVQATLFLAQEAGGGAKANCHGHRARERGRCHACFGGGAILY